MLEDGIITESNSTWAAPVVLVSKKKTKEMRFAIDYRGLNARTQVINFPIPDLQDALDSVGTAQSKIFIVMDLKSSFWQIPLHPETADRSAFITHDCCYQLTRVPYGITNGPMAFQMLMSKVLRGINFKFALVFIDDILCHSATIDQHLGPKLVHVLAFGTPKFHIAPYDTIKHELVNLSSNCDVKSGLRPFVCNLLTSSTCKFEI